MADSALYHRRRFDSRLRLRNILEAVELTTSLAVADSLWVIFSLLSSQVLFQAPPEKYQDVSGFLEAVDLTTFFVVAPSTGHRVF